MTLLMTLAKDILTAQPGAKPLGKSWSLWSMIFGATAWTTHNIALWFTLEQSTEATMFWAIIGLIWIACTLVSVARRHDIYVPEWIAVVAEAVLEGAPQP